MPSGNTRNQLEEEIREMLAEMEVLADDLAEEIDDARAQTTVKLKAMVQRLREKREEVADRLEQLIDPETDDDDGGGGEASKAKFERLAQKLEERLEAMKTTIRRRIR